MENAFDPSIDRIHDTTSRRGIVHPWGLFIGKQIGVFGFSILAVKLGLAKLPENIDWFSLYGLSVLCGIGFTMSLFISTLAFDSSLVDAGISARLGVLLGSFLSAIAGYFLLNYSLKREYEELKQSEG